MIPLILSGGSGTRLWPLSRSHWPKQHCGLFEDTLQNMTIKRCEKLGSPWILTNENLKVVSETFLKKSHLKVEASIYEPQARNTAAAIALFCRIMELKNRKNEVVGVFPADQLIQNEDLFLVVCREAEKLALQGQIVTLGITPSYPETGFGYIQTSKKALNTDPVLRAFSVEKFHEKPSLEKAKSFLVSGNFCWNAGIFIFQVETMIRAFQKHKPEIWKALLILKEDLSNLDVIYKNIEPISIDYAIMEKMDSRELSCFPVEMGWSDVGSWDAVAEKYLALGSQHKTKKSVLEIEAENNFVFSQELKKFVLVGVDNLIMIDTPDAVLVTQKGKSQDVKKAVESLTQTDRALTQDHQFETRPWGEFEVLRDADNFKSKVIRVSPQSQISYQSHSQREEHWIITKGQGEVIVDEKHHPVSAGSYVHIPRGAKHRIRNNTDFALEFVEVQLGQYFGEDDIVRYQDDYQRK